MSSKITGYAIIQLPDLILFVYNRIKKLKCVRNASKSNVIMVMPGNEPEEASNTDGVQNNSSDDSQNNIEGRDSINFLSRLPKIEDDNINVFQKLDDIAAANSTRLTKVEEDNTKFFKKVNDMTEVIDTIYNENITRLSKVEGVNNKLFKEMHDMNAAIDNLNDLNIRVLRFYDARNIETQFFVHRQKRNSQ